MNAPTRTPPTIYDPRDAKPTRCGDNEAEHEWKAIIDELHRRGTLDNFGACDKRTVHLALFKPYSIPGRAFTFQHPERERDFLLTPVAAAVAGDLWHLTVEVTRDMREPKERREDLEREREEVAKHV